MARIETERQIDCPLCGGGGESLFAGLRDGLFGAPGDDWGVRRCPRCEALWLDPRPTRASIGDAYRSYFTHAPPAGPRAIASAALTRLGLERAARVYRLGTPTPVLGALAAMIAGLWPGLADDVDLLARHLDSRAFGEGRLLDVGCGDGAALVFLQRLGWRASGVEIDAKAVAAARARGLDVVQGEIGSAGLADASFDAVTSSHVLEHVHDPLGFLVECRRVLTVGGTLVAVIPNTRSELFARHGRSWLGLDPPRHLVLFNADNLEQLARRAGFEDIRIRHAARATGFAHLASTLIARDGRYAWGRWPGLTLWLEAKRLQARATRDVSRGRAEGEELVLIARKPAVSTD